MLILLSCYVCTVHMMVEVTNRIIRWLHWTTMGSLLRRYSTSTKFTAYLIAPLITACCYSAKSSAIVYTYTYTHTHTHTHTHIYLYIYTHSNNLSILFKLVAWVSSTILISESLNKSPTFLKTVLQLNTYSVITDGTGISSKALRLQRDRIRFRWQLKSLRGGYVSITYRDNRECGH